MASKIRIILDTNWYISATINKNSRRILYQILTNSNITVLFSEEIIEEYRAVIVREKFKKLVKASQALRFLNLVIPKLEHITIKTSVKESRDPKDNYLLSLSAYTTGTPKRAESATQASLDIHNGIGFITQNIFFSKFME